MAFEDGVSFLNFSSVDSEVHDLSALEVKEEIGSDLVKCESGEQVTVERIATRNEGQGQRVRDVCNDC